MSAPAFIGVDAGGSKTLGVLATSTGEVLAAATGPGANYQTSGIEQATRVYAAVFAHLKLRARAENVDVFAASWGLAGLDRPRDRAALEGALRTFLPTDSARDVVNDTFAILRAGSTTGHGVAVVAGTGCNCVGVGPDGTQSRIGGLAYELGDFGGGHDIGVAGLRAAFRGADGRAPQTALTGAVREHFGIGRLDDLVDRLMVDAKNPLDPGEVTRLVFDAAKAGDTMAAQIVIDAGIELGVGARILADRLFGTKDAFPLVLGGSVLQKPDTGIMRDAIVHEVRSVFVNATPMLLDVPPVVGAVLRAMDAARESGRAIDDDASAHTALFARLRETLANTEPTCALPS